MLSVIVPCHNEAGYIERLLASLVRQTFDRRCFEVVVVDNASTDSTAAEVREFARDGPLDLRLVSERILGVSIARNRGAAASRHDVLVFLDADNIVRPEFLEAVAATFADNRVAGATIRTDAEPTDRFGPWLFAGLDIVPPFPGALPIVTHAGLWGAEDPESANDDGSRWFYAAVGRKP